MIGGGEADKRNVGSGEDGLDKGAAFIPYAAPFDFLVNNMYLDHTIKICNYYT